jgi:hypothetical protein
MCSKFWMLKAHTEGRHHSDWRQRVFILRDGVLCFVSEKKRNVLKRVCDVKRVTVCTVGQGMYKRDTTLVFTDLEAVFIIIIIVISLINSNNNNGPGNVQEKHYPRLFIHK